MEEIKLNRIKVVLAEKDKTELLCVDVKDLLVSNLENQ